MKPNFTQEHAYPGKLIILEGPDGSGKSTQTKFIKKHIIENGWKAIIITWKDGEHFRDYFSHHDMKNGVDVASPESHLLLQIADMLYQIERKVIPYLVQWYTVIMDRALPTIVIRALTLGFTLSQIERGLLWFSNTIYRDLFRDSTTIFLSVHADKTLENMAKRAKKEGNSGEWTLLSLHMVQNLRYLPDGEKLTKKTKRDLVAKLQATYVHSYHQYFSYHPAIIIDGNWDKKIVFQQILEAITENKV